MRDTCKGEAAQMYGVEPRRISPGVVTPDPTGFRINSTADKGPEGVKKLRCLFRSDRSFDHIMATVPDGE